MSQFPKKYYRHFYVSDAPPAKKEDDETVWLRWWARGWVRCTLFGSFAGIVTSALLWLLLPRLFIPAVSAAGHVPQVVSTAPVAAEKDEKSAASSSAAARELGARLPVTVLPPLQRLLPENEVTLGQYMYYVNDTRRGFPDFVDPDTNRIIVGKAPECARLDCPVTGIGESDKRAYARWLEALSGETFRVVDTPAGFRVEPAAAEANASSDANRL